MSIYLFGQESRSDTSTLVLSLAEANSYALEHSIDMEISNMDVEIAKKKIWETMAIGLPQVTANANYQYIFEVPVLKLSTPVLTKNDISTIESGVADTIPLFGKEGPPIPMGVQSNWTWDITASWLVFSGEYLVGLQASKVFYNYSLATHNKNESDVKENVTKSYYLALVLDENASILRENLTVVNKTFEELKKMKEQGFVEETDMDQLEITKNTLLNALNSLDRQKETAKRLLKFQMGVELDRNIVLSDSVPSLIKKTQIDNFIFEELVLNNNLDYASLEYMERLQILGVRREQSKYLPTVALVYKHQQLLNEPFLNFTPKDIFAISISLPLFTSYSRHSKIQQAKISLEKTRNSKYKLEQGLNLSYEQSKNDFLAAHEKYTLSHTNFNLSKKIYDRTLIKYSVGSATSFELSQAQGQYLKTQSEFFSAILELLNAKTKIDKITNKL